MKFVLVPMGSAGDVHPLVWLGKLLLGRGHEVVMIAQEVIAEIPERAGIRVVRVGSRAAQEGVIRDARLWHPRKAVGLLLEHMPAWAKETLAAVERERAAGEMVLIGGGLALGARVAAERWGVPLVTVHLQPSVMMSAQEMPVLGAGLAWARGAPRWVRRGVVGLAHWKIDRAIRGAVNELRREAGIQGAGVKGVMKNYWHSPDGVLCLFPEWFGAKAEDWPNQAVTTRFPLYDEAQERGTDAALERFLADGERPVAITPGSANAQAGAFLREAVEALRVLGRRGIVLTRFSEQVPANLPMGVKAIDYAAFSQVFPRAAAVVHHGGVGTMAQCFAAGVPQVVMPMAHDQPDNAARMKTLGVGEVLYPAKFRSAAIAEKLAKVTASAAVAEACVRVRAAIERQMPGEEVAEIVEGMARNPACERSGVG